MYDVIIAGGGPAGLLAAIGLSKEYKVLLIERGKIGATQATWYSYKNRILDNNLEEAIELNVPYIKFESPTATHLMKDDCVIMNHQKVMDILVQRAFDNGVEIIEEEFQSVSQLSDGISVSTNKENYKGRLLIDSMGIRSKIIAENKLIKRKDAWVIYGAKINLKQELEELELEYYPLNDEENTYVGVHPYNKKELNFYVFKGVKDSIGNPSELHTKFNETLERTHPGAEITETLQGTIVSGELKKYALNRIVFFGSSGMLNPDGCGMGFNEILLRHKLFSESIQTLLKEDRLHQKALNKAAKGLKNKETLAFQRIIGAFSLYFIKSPGKWDGGVKWLNAMGENSKYWMRNEMTMDWIMSANINLNKTISMKETYKMIPFNEFLFIFKNLVRFSFRAIFYKLSWLKRKRVKEISS